jgi:ATP-dependent DNA ligase
MLDEYRRILDAEESIKEIIIMGDGAATVDNKILHFSESDKILRTAYQNKTNDKLYHHYPFDIYSMNGSTDNMAWSTKMRTLIGLFETSTYIHPVHYVAHDLEKAWTSLTNRKGVEGLVARNDQGKNFKIKKTYSFDLVIIAVGNDNHDAWKNRKAAYIKCAFMDNKGNYIKTSAVMITSNKLKLKLYTWATGHIINREKNEMFVTPLKIVEVKWKEIYKKNCPVYKYRSDGYGIVGESKACVMIQPELVRFRNDKKVDESDLGIRQIP